MCCECAMVKVAVGMVAIAVASGTNSRHQQHQTRTHIYLSKHVCVYVTVPNIKSLCHFARHADDASFRCSQDLMKWIQGKWPINKRIVWRSGEVRTYSYLHMCVCVCAWVCALRVKRNWLTLIKGLQVTLAQMVAVVSVCVHVWLG